MLSHALDHCVYYIMCILVGVDFEVICPLPCCTWSVSLVKMSSFLDAYLLQMREPWTLPKDTLLGHAPSKGNYFPVVLGTCPWSRCPDYVK
jgi:hypothetical protein